MRRDPALGAQGIALLDAKAMLLIHDDQPEVGEVDGLLEQRVGADHDSGLTARDLEQILPTLRRGLRPSEQRHPGPEVGAAEQAALGERAEQGRDRTVVLLGQHLRRRQQCGLTAGVDDGEHRAQRDHGLPRPHLALEQSVHGMVRGQIAGQVSRHLLLAAGQRERQPGVEVVDQPTVHRRPGDRGLGPRLRPAPSQHHLQHERLVILQPLPGALRLLARLRSMDLLVCLDQ